MTTLIISVLASIISVVNPLGAMPMFISLTSDYTSREKSKTSLQVSFYFTLILLSFFLLGTYILSFFGISINAMRIAGGLVILSSGYGLLSGNFEKNRSVNAQVKEEARIKQDISFTPMAMPLLSGPGSISLLITYYNEYPEWNQRLIIMFVIILSGVLIYLTLRTSSYLNKFLGVAGLNAVSRIMGFLVMSIGVQYIIVGVVALIDSLK
jgi:multiple antibiotic resistance protein